MGRYVLARLIGIVGVLIAVSIITFLLMHTVPGGPFDTSQQQEMPLPEYIREALVRKYHLDRPLHQQYLSYMSRTLQGDLGISFRYGEPVTEFLQRAWPRTIILGLITLAVSITIGVSFGIIQALRPNTWVDYVMNVVVVTGIVTPTFVVAVLMIAVFAVNLHWFPTGGWGTPKQLVMPVIAFAMASVAGIAKYTRASMLEAMRAEYIRTARAKGLHARAVVLRHAFKNALIPLLTIAGPTAASMITGSFFIETIFRIPGIGNQLTLGIINRDYPVIMSLTLIWASLIALTYLATDLLYAFVDPRVKLEGGTA